MTRATGDQDHECEGKEEDDANDDDEEEESEKPEDNELKED